MFVTLEHVLHRKAGWLEFGQDAEDLPTHPVRREDLGLPGVDILFWRPGSMEEKHHRALGSAQPWIVVSTPLFNCGEERDRTSVVRLAPLNIFLVCRSWALFSVTLLLAGSVPQGRAAPHSVDSTTELEQRDVYAESFKAASQ